MVKCELCEHEGGRGEIFPNCKCGRALGCSRCRGSELRVRCKYCKEETLLFDHWRSLARPFPAGKHDQIGTVCYTPNGMPFICEGDRFYRACRLDRIPVRRTIHTLSTGEYLDEEGKPLFPDDWLKERHDELNEKEKIYYDQLRQRFTQVEK